MKQSSRLTDLVVLVDDDPAIRETLTFVLDVEGLPTVSVADGVAGLETIRDRRPKVAIVDATMPRMDGYELCAAVRADPDLHGIFLIFLSGDCDPDASERAFVVGADAWIAKPYDNDEVVEVVSKAFENPGSGKQRK